MNKRQEANMRVKARITAALLTLLNEKSISDITVTEIISEAGVARASFYRNYCSRRWNWSAGQRIRADALANDQRVHQIIYLLQEISRNHRQGKTNELLKNRTFC